MLRYTEAPGAVCKNLGSVLRHIQHEQLDSVAKPRMKWLSFMYLRR